MFQINKDKRGFSQINLLIGVAFLGVVVFLVMHTIQKQTDSLRNITAEAEVENYLHSVKRHLTSPLNCNETFMGAEVDGHEINSIKVAQGNSFSTKFEIGTSFGTSATKIISYRTSGYNNFQEDIADLGMINLVISMKKNIESISAANITRNIKLYIKTVDNKISECAFGGLPTGENIAERTEEGIQLNSAFIGIGTQNVLANLSVKDSITLESDTTPCSADNIGSIKFNSAMYQFEQCKQNLQWMRVHK